MSHFILRQMDGRRAIFRRDLALLVVVGLMVFGVAVPSSLVVSPTESSSPTESEEETQEKIEEAITQSPRRPKLLRHRHVDRICLRRARPSLRLSRTIQDSARAGHRLPNGLMAPLTS